MSWYKLYKQSMPMIQEDQLPENYDIKVYQQGVSVVFEIQNIHTEEEVAYLEIQKVDDDVWYVAHAYSPVKGYGPTLYDLAMRFTSNRGDGLISNQEAVEQYGVRGETSDEASPIWDFYVKKRDDVIKDDKGFRFLEKQDKINPEYVQNDLSDADLAFRIKKLKKQNMDILQNAIDSGTINSLNLSDNFSLLDHEYFALLNRAEQVFKNNGMAEDQFGYFKMLLEDLKNKR